MSEQAKQKGFTLIELMMVVAIIGILLAVAYPSYRDSILRSDRALAQAALASLSGAMEQYYAQENTYENATMAKVGHPANVPLDGGTAVYTIGIKASSATASSYVLEATPKNADNKVYYTLSSDGTKQSGKSLSASDLSDGWAH